MLINNKVTLLSFLKEFYKIIIYSILRNIKKEKNKYTLISYLIKAINEARPVLTLIGKKRGGKVYKVPVSISINREVFQAIQWTIKETCGFKQGDYKKLLLISSSDRWEVID